LALLGGALLVAALVLAPSASAKRDIKVGFADDAIADRLLFDADDDERGTWAKRLRKTNAELVRLNTYWSAIASPSEPADATDPADHAYDWDELDRAIRASTDEGVEPLLTVLNAPLFAEGPNRPNDEDLRPGTWKPQSDKLRDFAVALATRYSGKYPDPLIAGEQLPRVRYYEGWNEPNLHLYINPQRTKKDKNRSPEIYRKLLNGFYEGIKSVNGSNKVLAAGTSPFGDKKGDRRIPPVEFWRDVLCLKNAKKLKFDRSGCPSKDKRAKLDIFAHNSINSPGDGPSTKAELRDNATAADMSKLVDVIRAAEKHGTVTPKGKREVWSTELWYESNPPEKRNGSKLRKHARNYAEVLYLLWKQRVSAGIFLQLRDSPYDPDSASVIGLQSGVYFLDGSRKPALDAVRFPFVADRKGKAGNGKVKVLAWGKSPRSGRLEIERRKAKRGWGRVASVSVKRGEVFRKKVKVGAGERVRATVGKERSISWKVGGK
jgi:hypothetical protein